jgi:hypothetical protein
MQCFSGATKRLRKMIKVNFYNLLLKLMPTLSAAFAAAGIKLLVSRSSIWLVE